MIFGVLTTQYTWNSSICIFLFNRTALQVFVTYLTGALYVHPLWFYRHQHDNQVHSTQNSFSLLFAALLVNCAPSREMHNYCTPHIIKENLENFLIHRCNYMLLSQVCCVWQVVKTATVILNNPVFVCICEVVICLSVWLFVCYTVHVCVSLCAVDVIPSLCCIFQYVFIFSIITSTYKLLSLQTKKKGRKLWMHT